MPPLRRIMVLCLAAAAIVIASGGRFAIIAAGAEPAEPTQKEPTQKEPNGRNGERQDWGQPAELPLPRSMSVAAYEDVLFDFLNTRKYVELGWLRDKSLRDTGPFINGEYYGTHPAVRVFYSPEIIRWLVDGRVGRIPDGAMIVKEQYGPPAVRHAGKSDEELWKSLGSWTVMVKDAKGSHDGWYWGNPVKDQCVVDNNQYAFDHHVTGFGHYCVRCHAATRSPNATEPHKDNEFTFASLRNIEGFPGKPLIFRVDDSWRATYDEEPSGDDPHEISEDNEKRLAALTDPATHPKCTQTTPPTRPERKSHRAFLELYRSIGQQQTKDVLPIPPVTHDWVVQNADGNRDFLTSNQCMSCHAGMTLPFGPSMFVAKGTSNKYEAPGWHIAPYGEWRWTPMGLAGRDPVFYAQMETELAILKKEFASDPATADKVTRTLVTTCLRCHGAMGKHQFDIDHAGTDETFTLEHVYDVASGSEHLGHGDTKYGALARDGISCMVCHRSQPRPQPDDDPRPYLQYFLETSITGNLHFGKPNEIYGPYKDEELAPYAMQHATAIKPKYSAYVKSSQLCGSCHVVNLPVVDKPFLPHEDESGSPERILANAESVPMFRDFHHHVEQATYLEWLNSEYENEFKTDNPRARSCQDCHMSKNLVDERHNVNVAKLRTRAAAIQDNTYPDAENLADEKDLEIRIRDEFSRHNFSGLNVFLLELFRQFDDVLGVRKNDFMTGDSGNLGDAIYNMQSQARHDVATLEVSPKLVAPRELEASVVLTNKVGHRFPSGVGFRRAFLELLVVEPPTDDKGDERIVWSSGRTNELGVIVDEQGRPLPTEFFERNELGIERYQRHHDVITSPQQVQIYETLLWNTKHKFTTSFIHGCDIVKDNRLLPKGWTEEGPDPSLNGYFLKSTYPGQVAKKDPRYQDGSGSDEVLYRITLPTGVDAARLQVRATLYYQAMPPYFLQALFTTAPDGPATQRLHFMLSHFNHEESAVKNWKLPVTSAQAAVTKP